MGVDKQLNAGEDAVDLGLCGADEGVAVRERGVKPGAIEREALVTREALDEVLLSAGFAHVQRLSLIHI